MYILCDARRVQFEEYAPNFLSRDQHGSEYLDAFKAIGLTTTLVEARCVAGMVRFIRFVFAQGD